MYNAATYLDECLDSIASQIFREFECWIVDDGSTDGSSEIAKRYCQRDPRFQCLSLPHQGIVAALNTAISHCKGSYIARMDADDRMHPERLALQQETMQENPSWIATGCHVRCFPHDQLGDGFKRYEAWLNQLTTAESIRRESLIECPIAHPTLFMRRSRLTTPLYRDCGWPEDYDLLLRWLNQGATVGTVPKYLHDWRLSPQRLSKTHPRYAESAFTRCKAAFLAQHFLEKQAHYILWGYGATGKALKKALTQHGKTPAYIVEVHPRRIGKVIQHAPVIEAHELKQLRHLPLVVSVAGAKPRQQIRDALKQMHFIEEKDYVITA